eukprot:2763889-Rhodomonas_salina.3
MMWVVLVPGDGGKGVRNTLCRMIMQESGGEVPAPNYRYTISPYARSLWYFLPDLSGTYLANFVLPGAEPAAFGRGNVRQVCAFYGPGTPRAVEA